MTDEYRKHLTETYEELSTGYARTLITLAGGALAISMAFVKDIVGTDGEAFRVWLMVAWACWAVSLCLVLGAYYCGREAARFAIKQHDRPEEESGDVGERPGGAWAVAVDWLGGLSLAAFVGGIFVFVTFVFKAWSGS